MPPSSRLAHAILLVCVASAALLRTAPADAGSLTAQNTTAVTAYQAGTPTPNFSGPNPYVAQAPIGAEFQTDSLTLQATAGAGGDVLLDLEYLTRFSGSEAVDGVSVTYADIFLGNATASATNGYVYAISLGDETRNGGLEAGFYSVAADKMSQAIWGSRPGYVYGGAYGASAASMPGQTGYTAIAAPTVLTAGAHLAGVIITQTAIGAGWYTLDAHIILTPAEAAYFGQGIDVFWGTGDCANGSFMAAFSALPMPEPCTAALLASGLFYLLMRRRGRVRPAPYPARSPQPARYEPDPVLRPH
jgi:hypothetical protein